MDALLFVRYNYDTVIFLKKDGECMQPTMRFDGRAKQYSKFRPSYPAPLLDYLRETVGWDANYKIADIGAGTGIFTSLLLEQGYEVVAVEPNNDMRNELQQQLQPYSTTVHDDKVSDEQEPGQRLSVSAGSAEATGLANASVQGIVCAQSFHWFDAELARAEFKRVLVSQGKVVLLWNQRDIEASPFMEAYEALFMKYGEQYSKVKHKQISVENLTPFYGGKNPALASFRYEQSFDKDGLIGRIASSSFSLTEQDARYEAFISDVDELFAKHEQHGEVTMKYRTDVYWGQLD